MRTKRLLVCGALAGCVAAIKYTLLGAMVGLCIIEGVLALREGGVRRALKSAGVFLCGMAIPILPWMVYFAVNGALSDAYTAYLYNNIFLYSSEAATWGQKLYDGACALRDNALWVVPAALGMAALAFDRGETRVVRLCVWAMAAFQFATVFLIGRVWAYSLLALAPFFPVGCMQLHRALKKAGSLRWRKGLTAAICAAGLAWTYFATPNAFLRGQKLETLAQGRLAAYVEEGASLLQYNHLDDGLYLTTHTVPQEKYFVRLNVHLDEMRSELDRAVREAVPDYVLVGWDELPAEFDRYQLIATDVGYDDSNRLNKMLYLYRRKSE